MKLQKLKKKNRKITKQNTRIFQKNKVISSKIDVLSEDRNSLETQIETLKIDEIIEQKNNMWKTQVEKTYHEKMENYNQSLPNISLDDEMMNQDILSTYIRELEETKLQNKTLLKEKSTYQEQLSEEKEKSQKLLNEIIEMTQKNKMLNKTNKIIVKKNRVISSKIEILSEDKIVLKIPNKTLDEKIKENKQKDNKSKNQYEKTNNEHLNRFYYDKSKQQPKENLVKVPQSHDDRTEINSNVEFVQINELEENPITLQNHQNDVVHGTINHKTVDEVYDFDTKIISLKSLIDSQKQN